MSPFNLDMPENNSRYIPDLEDVTIFCITDTLFEEFKIEETKTFEE